MDLKIVVFDDHAVDVVPEIGRRLEDLGVAKPALQPPWSVTIGDEFITVHCRAVSDASETRTEFTSGREQLARTSDLILLDNDWEKAQRKERFGLDVLKEAAWRRGHGPVLAIYTDAITYKPEFVKESLTLGADALVYKKEPTHFLNLLLSAIDRKRQRVLQDEWRRLSGVLAEKDPGLIAASPAMQRVLEDAAALAPWRNEMVLLLGEIGTGKTRLAKAIHDSSPRAKAPFVTLDPGHISDTLLQAELFGVERGAFTGAVARKGILESADGGTVFIDEVENISSAMQDALLRVLQDRRYVRPGDPKERRIDARFFFATNQEPTDLIRAGKLRADLYSRIEQNVLRLPSLVDRLEDIPLLCNLFVSEFYAENLPSITPPKVTSDAIDKLMKATWPDNVRGLRNAIRRSLVRAEPGAELTAENIILSRLPEASTAVRADDLGRLLDLAPRAGSQRAVFDRLIQRAPDPVSNLELNEAIESTATDLASDALMVAISRLRDRLKVRGFDIRQNKERKGYALVRLVENA